MAREREPENSPHSAEADKRKQKGRYVICVPAVEVIIKKQSSLMQVRIRGGRGCILKLTSL